MVTLSAHNKHSPTTRAVLSPTLEQQFDSTKMKYSDEIKSISTAINKDIENVETSTKKNCAKAISQTNLNSTCVKEVNVMQKTLTENENNSNDFSKQISTRKEMFKLHKLIPKTADIPQNFTAYVGTLAEKNENEESDKEVINKSFEIEHIPKSQTLPRMFRGDLHDSGISDCGSSLMTPSVHVEPGIVSTIKEEIDHEGPNRESKQILKNEDNRRSSTAEILVNLVQSKKTFPYDTEIIADGDKVATKHNVTKASFETNPVQKGVCISLKLF